MSPWGITPSGLCVPGQALLKNRSGLEPGEPLPPPHRPPTQLVSTRRNYPSGKGLWSQPRCQLSGCPPPCQLVRWGPLRWRCVGCNLITSQPTTLLVGALRSQGLCAWEMPAPRSPFLAIQIRYSEPFMKILIKPEAAAPAFPLLFRSYSVLWITIS